MLARWFSAFESFRRAVESLHKMQAKKDGGGINAADVLESIRNDKQSD
jgi:hypothetical protein